MDSRRRFLKTFGLTSAGVFAAGVGFRASSCPACNLAPAGNDDGDEAEQYTVGEVRKAARHFAMLYFNFCKTLVETLGEEQAFSLVQKAIFDLSLDRTDRMREKALAKGLELTQANFAAVNDLPTIAWRKWEPSSGEVRCPYAEAWLKYYKQYPWFKRFAPLYCDVIDTTNIENFSRTTSHRITKNLLWGDEDCDREFFESETVKAGKFTYGTRSSGTNTNNAQ
jgi:hypothetical protein